MDAPDVSINDLLAGRLLSPRTCPHCGRAPSDFEERRPSSRIGRAKLCSSSCGCGSPGQNVRETAILARLAVSSGPRTRSIG